MVRAFIAVPIPRQAEEALGATMEALRREGAWAVRWVGPEGIHLTFKFLGEVDPDRIETILDAMSRASEGTGSVQLALSNWEHFPAEPILGCSGWDSKVT